MRLTLPNGLTIEADTRDDVRWLVEEMLGKVLELSPVPSATRYTPPATQSATVPASAVTSLAGRTAPKGTRERELRDQFQATFGQRFRLLVSNGEKSRVECAEPSERANVICEIIEHRIATGNIAGKAAKESGELDSLPVTAEMPEDDGADTF